MNPVAPLHRRSIEDGSEQRDGDVTIEQMVAILRESRGVSDWIIYAEPDDTHRNDKSEASYSTKSRSERIA